MTDTYICCERDVIHILSILCGPLCLHKRRTYLFRMSEGPSKQHQGNKHQNSLRGNKAEVPRDARGAITAHFSSSSFPIFSGAAAADGRLPRCTPKMWRPRSENMGPGIQSRGEFNIYLPWVQLILRNDGCSSSNEPCLGNLQKNRHQNLVTERS